MSFLDASSDDGAQPLLGTTSQAFSCLDQCQDALTK